MIKPEYIGNIVETLGIGMDFFPVDGKTSEKMVKIVFAFFLDREFFHLISGSTAASAVAVQPHAGGTGHTTESLSDRLEEFLAVGVFPEVVIVKWSDGFSFSRRF